MINMNIMDIFYNEIIKEAAKGEIHAYMNYNIIFSTYIENTFILQANNDSMDIRKENRKWIRKILCY